MPASAFFSAGALPAGALPAVEGFFSAALGGIFDNLTNIEEGWDLVRKKVVRDTWCSVRVKLEMVVESFVDQVKQM